MATRKKASDRKRGKGGKKSARRSAKKSPKKASKKKSSGKKSKRSSATKTRKKAAQASGGPTPVRTGRGPEPAEVATRVTALLRAGKADEVERDWLSPKIESVEGLGASLAWSGKKSVLAKYRGWEADHEIHEMELEGPWVGATGFCLRFRIDVTEKSTGQRSGMEEIAVYTVRNGRIVREEFHFATG